MPTIAPWLTPTDTLGAMQGGSAAGAQFASIRQRANEAQQAQAARMAEIAVRQQAQQQAAQEAAARTALQQLQMTMSQKQAGAEMGLQRDKLSESARQFDVGLTQKAGMPAESPWSGPVTLKDGRVIQVNQVTGEPREVAKSAQMPTFQRQTNEKFSNIPALQSEEKDFQSKLMAGVSAEEALMDHPMMLQVEPYRSKYGWMLAKQDPLAAFTSPTATNAPAGLNFGGNPWNMEMVPPPTNSVPQVPQTNSVTRFVMRDGKLVRE